MKLNHRQLEAFLALIETGSVTAAATRIHVTQPAVSRLIADLEHSIGYALFRREKKRLSPTLEALALFEEVDRSFIGLATIAEAAQDIGNFRRGSLHIAGLPALALDFLPRMISKFCKDRPDISVSLQIHSSQRVVQCIASQQFDIGFAESKVEHPNVISKTLYKAPMVAILPKGHPLLERSELTPQDFENEKFVSLGANYLTRQRIDAVFLASNVNRIMQVETQLSMAVGNLVAAGAGISLIDPVTAFNLRDRGLVETRPFLPEVNYSYCVLLPSHRPLSRLGETFLEISSDSLRQAVAHQSRSSIKSTKMRFVEPTQTGRL